jgi:hypothetical protein
MTTTTTTRLPAQFADLEPFAKAWSQPTERQRYDQRLASTMEELQAFYDAIYPRAKDALAYLDTFDLYDMPDEALNLMRMLYSLSTISFAVDCFKQPKMPDSGSSYLDVISEPYP